MGQFKPMVKMMTDEPSVILKLKKGGKVHAKHHEEHGHKSMHHAAGGMMHGAHEAFESEHGKAPSKPSMSERRKAMNPNQYAKGGKVEKELHKVEKELKHHEKMKDAEHGGKAHAKHGGKIHHKASGGAIDRDETKTTIKGNAKKFEKTKVVDGQKHDKHHGTGVIKEDKPAGYKHGGHAHKHHKATGGAIPADTDEKVNKGKIKMHGTIEGNEHDYLNTEMHQAKRDKAHGTGGIKESNAGGYKHGGHAKKHHKATGGAIPAATEKNMREGHLKGDTYEGGDWEERAADTATGGVKNRMTGGVREANAGGYKHGGHAKKHFATGGNVVDDGKAVKMPRHFVSRPVANSLQSGTFKKGGKVHKDVGGNVDAKGVSDKASRELEEAMNPLSMAKELYGKAKSYLTGSPSTPGAVTKTKESVTVAPNKKRGGKVC